MKIVILDALPAFAELDLAPLSAIGDVAVYDSTRPEQVEERLAGADVVLTNKVRLGAKEFAISPSVRLVSVLATGYDMVDIDAAKAAGVTVCNVTGYSTASTAQAAIALLLELTHQVGAHASEVADGAWTRRGIWSWWDQPPIELDGRNALIVGLGAIGSRVGRALEAFGMNVRAASLPGRDAPRFSPYTRVALTDGLAVADVVMLHCPLTPQTRGLIGVEALAVMKPTTLLVNAARGAVVDEAAVANALRSGRLAGYATDVLSVEPPPANHPLIGAPHCVVTPHLAWASPASRTRLLAQTAGNIRAFLNGTPRNEVTG